MVRLDYFVSIQTFMDNTIHTDECRDINMFLSCNTGVIGIHDRSSAQRKKEESLKTIIHYTTTDTITYLMFVVIKSGRIDEWLEVVKCRFY